MICPITDIIVKPLEHDAKENTTWYPIRVQVYTNQTLDLHYQYSDFAHYAKRLHQEFQPYLKKHQLLKLQTNNKKLNFYYYSSKNSQKYNIQRQVEIETFCKQLLALPPDIQCSDTFLSFFIIPLQQQTVAKRSPGLLKRSFSIHGKKKPEIIATTSVAIKVPSPPVSPVEETCIKFKIIYDMNNMVVIRVSRSITLHQLKLKVIQKFSMLNIDLTEAMTLRVIQNYQRYSISSCSSAEDSLVEFNPPVQLDLKNEHDFSKAMQYQTQKVILKCIP